MTTKWRPAWKDQHQHPSSEYGARKKVETCILLHDLRHTHATWLIAQRIPMIAIAGRFGARECVMTMMVYAHVDKLVDWGLLTAGELGLAAPVPTPVVELALGRATRPAEGSACNGGRP